MQCQATCARGNGSLRTCMSSMGCAHASLSLWALSRQVPGSVFTSRPAIINTLMGSRWRSGAGAASLPTLVPFALPATCAVERTNVSPQGGGAHLPTLPLLPGATKLRAEGRSISGIAWKDLGLDVGFGGAGENFVALVTAAEGGFSQLRERAEPGWDREPIGQLKNQPRGPEQ